MAGWLPLFVPSDPWTTLDGRLNAPVATAQHPTILNGYSARPPWRVSGVDYAVGIPTAVSLIDPFISFGAGTLKAALVSAGATFNTGNNVMTFSGSSATNAVIDGYDFSLHNGVSTQVDTCTNFTFQNCKWQVGSNLRQPIQVAGSVNGFTLKFCSIDGNNLNYVPNGGGALVQINAYGTTTVQYNLIKNAWGQLMGVGTSSSGNPTFSLKYNVLHDSGLGFAVDATHGDWIQFLVASGQVVNSVDGSFNLLYQNDALSAGSHTQGLSVFSAGGQAPSAGSCLGETFSNNTIVATSNCLDPVLINNSYLNGSATCNTNYADVVGSGGTVWCFFGQNNGGPGGVGPFTGTLNTLTGNINMNNGASFNTHDG